MWGLVKVPGEWKQKQACPPLLDLSSRPAINTSVWRSQFQWHGNLSLPLRWATAGPLRLGLGSLQPDPKGWVAAAAVAFLPFVLFPSMRTIPASSPFQHFCHLPFFFFFFSKGFIYTAFMLFCLMKTVWICAFQTAQKTDPPPPHFFTRAEAFVMLLPQKLISTFQRFVLHSAVSPCRCTTACAHIFRVWGNSFKLTD